jgi:NTE family protein
MATQEKCVDLVFEGGGVKGIALGGAFQKLHDDGWQAQRVAGTSAGAITAAVVAAGYSGAQVRDLVLNEMEFAKFADAHGGLLGQGLEFLHRGGLHSGDYFLAWMRDLLAAQGVRRFGDLRAGNGATDPASQYRLQVIATDLTEHRLLVLPRDAGRLGIDPDRLEVAEAVRMSMSIPIFFAPWVVRDSATGSEITIVDGGVLSNFPVWLFDCPPGKAPRWPTFGLLLVAPDQRQPIVCGPEAELHGERKLTGAPFLLAIARTMMEAHDRLYVERAEFARTIPIPTLGVGTTQFGIAPDEKQRLFQSGRDAAAHFLSTWDFEAYKRAFRAGAAQPTRRERLVADIGAAQPVG